jgi:hypothetical protein
MTTHRRSHAQKRQTRRAGSRRGTTVEKLHSSFSAMDHKIRSVIEKGITDSDLAEHLRDQWSKHFHQDLSDAAAKGMVQHYRAVYGSGKSGRRTRKHRQHGGMAPMNWTLGQGTAAAVYGRFPVDMGTSGGALKALDMNRFYESSISRACDSTGGCAAPNQSGGGAYEAFLMGKMPASVPRGVLETAVSTVQGSPISDPPRDPTNATWSVPAYQPVPFNGSLSNLSSLATMK